MGTGPTVRIDVPCEENGAGQKCDFFFLIFYFRASKFEFEPAMADGGEASGRRPVPDALGSVSNANFGARERA